MTKLIMMIVNSTNIKRDLCHSLIIFHSAARHPNSTCLFPTWTKNCESLEDLEWDHPGPILVKLLKTMNATLGDEGNSSRESDKPLVGVLYVEQAATRLEIISNSIQTFNLFLSFFSLFVQQAEKDNTFIQEAQFKTFSVMVDLPVRVCQLLQFPSGRTLQSLPERHYKWYIFPKKICWYFSEFKFHIYIFLFLDIILKTPFHRCHIFAEEESRFNCRLSLSSWRCQLIQARLHPSWGIQLGWLRCPWLQCSSG